VLLSLQRNRSHPKNRINTTVVLAVCLALSACGGGGDSSPAPTTTDAPGCDVTRQKDWLRAYMADQYFWTGTSPNPDPFGYATVQSYYDALLFTGDAVVPKDKWSYITPTAAYNQFFGAGKSMSYGVFVNGVEGVLPLRLRYVEPQSPAAQAGLKRGDIIVSANTRSASELITSKDFSVLTPANAGDSLTLEIDSGTGPRSVTLTAASFDLTPVSVSQVLRLPNGSNAGYVVLKDFISQAESSLTAVFADFRARRATELIIDLRYNGGGLLSTSNLLASLVAGASSSGQVFAQLNRNARNQAANATFRLTTAPAPAFSRVVVLTGSRTCSASELLVNGLKPYVNVITIGAATCGKPFGFYPVDHCGNTFSAVNFETVNGAGQGRYYDGIAPTCAAIDDFKGELGTASEGLTAVAADYLQTGVCSTVSVPLAGSRRSALGFATLPNGRPD
jgi:carboxyl-terminal processing protease